jgi:hypothetical protein
MEDDESVAREIAASFADRDTDEISSSSSSSSSSTPIVLISSDSESDDESESEEEKEEEIEESEDEVSERDEIEHANEEEDADEEMPKKEEEENKKNFNRRLSFDLGPRNTSLADVKGSKTDPTKFEIIDWRLEDICDDVHRTIERVIDALIDKLSKRYDHIDVKSVYDEVLIERQPKQNLTTFTMSYVMRSYFRRRGVKVRMIDGSEKMTLCTHLGAEDDVKEMHEYSRRHTYNKRVAIAGTKRLLKDRPKDLKFFEKHKKKDDLADALLQERSVEFVRQKVFQYKKPPANRRLKTSTKKKPKSKKINNKRKATSKSTGTKKTKGKNSKSEKKRMKQGKKKKQKVAAETKVVGTLLP